MKTSLVGAKERMEGKIAKILMTENSSRSFSVEPIKPQLKGMFSLRCVNRSYICRLMGTILHREINW